MLFRRKVMRIISWGGIGDVLLSTPSFMELKQRDKHRRIIVYCRSKPDVEVYRNNPYIDRVRRTAFNPVFHLLNNLRLVKFHTYNYAALNPSLSYKRNATEIIAEMLGVELSCKKIQVYLTPDEESRAAALLMNYHNPIILHITSRTSANQHWPTERWEQLVREMPDHTFIQLGVTKEPGIAGTIDLRGKTTIREALALLKQARSFVGVVSSFSHATGAFDTPGVVLFGASTPVVWGHANNINIYKSLRCAPCIDVLLGSPCPYGRPCMTMITVEEVKAALLRQLGTEDAVHAHGLQEFGRGPMSFVEG
jgi:ADP-heptose:LPS heptosyltransferase